MVRALRCAQTSCLTDMKSLLKVVMVLHVYCTIVECVVNKLSRQCPFYKSLSSSSLIAWRIA